MNKPGQIIIVNGTSGSGKSTTCDLFQKRSEDFWLLYGIDHFTAESYPAKFGQHGLKSREGIYNHPIDEADPEGPLRWSFGPKGWQAFHALHEWVAASSRAGCNIILDHLLLNDPPVLQDLIWRLEGLPVLLVTLKPPYEVLEDRVTNRKMDKKNPAAEQYGDEAIKRIISILNRLRPYFYETVYANEISDLEIDTSACSPEAVCEMIEARLANGPGTAFDELRAKFPKRT